MFSFKTTLLTSVGLFVIVGALATVAALLPLISLGQQPGPAQPPPTFGNPGNFYLTKTAHNGAQAKTACAAGYHMASIWEIHDPSNLTYNTAYGFTDAYSGIGPPYGLGWIRTGEASMNGNCFAWTSADASVSGKMVFLSAVVDVAEAEALSPWAPWQDSCNTKHGVWCVHD
jgi:hypothetical protein